MNFHIQIPNISKLSEIFLYIINKILDFTAAKINQIKIIYN